MLGTEGCKDCEPLKEIILLILRIFRVPFEQCEPTLWFLPRRKQWPFCKICNGPVDIFGRATVEVFGRISSFFAMIQFAHFLGAVEDFRNVIYGIDTVLPWLTRFNNHKTFFITIPRCEYITCGDYPAKSSFTVDDSEKRRAVGVMKKRMYDSRNMSQGCKLIFIP